LPEPVKPAQPLPYFIDHWNDSIAKVDTKLLSNGLTVVARRAAEGL
jgi:hypothetical protein